MTSLQGAILFVCSPSQRRDRAARPKRTAGTGAPSVERNREIDLAAYLIRLGTAGNTVPRPPRAESTERARRVTTPLSLRQSALPPASARKCTPRRPPSSRGRSPECHSRSATPSGRSSRSATPAGRTARSVTPGARTARSTTPARGSRSTTPGPVLVIDLSSEQPWHGGGGSRGGGSYSGRTPQQSRARSNPRSTYRSRTPTATPVRYSASPAAAARPSSGHRVGGMRRSQSTPNQRQYALADSYGNVAASVAATVLPQRAMP
jgi:hypothetical protein